MGVTTQSREVTSNERKILLKNFEICRIHYNRFFSIDIKKGTPEPIQKPSLTTHKLKTKSLIKH